jgi:hypothetical protein
MRARRRMRGIARLYSGREVRVYILFCVCGEWVVRAGLRLTRTYIDVFWW